MISSKSIPPGRMIIGGLTIAALMLSLFVSRCMECKSVQFGVVADVQYADKANAGSRYYAASLSGLERCVADFNQKEPAFVIQLGDLIDGGPNAAGELRTVRDVYNRLRMPHYHVLGNHDFSGIDRTEVLDTLSLERGDYCFDQGCWRFIVLDTQDVAIEGGWPKDSQQYQQAVSMLERLKAEDAPNAMEWNGGLGQAQLAWLETELDDAERDGKWVIVFGHLPLMPAGHLHAAWNSPEVVSILDRHPCVKAYICGHNHRGDYALHNGIHYVTLEAMVEAADKDGAWAMVTLSRKKLVITGIGVTSRDMSIIDK